MAGFISRIPKYWLFQSIGWGIFVLTNTFFALTFDRLDGLFVGRLVIYVVMGVSFSHLMRDTIIKTNVLQRPLNLQIIGFILITLFFSLVMGILETLLMDLFNLRIVQEEKAGETAVIFRNFFNAFVYFFIWNSIYYLYHYIEKSRRQQFDTLRLQSLVKELELKTIKSHINPHFIFNALNSIRALIDENPSRARNAITELSNILRSSMQSENLETVPLERELNIVKHGISKYVDGGVVRIISDFSGENHELIVRNTGKLNGGMNREGFGLNSTASRLGLLFGDRAKFEIHDLAGNMVEAKVSIPVQV
jgi:sensor histidine kinase YesM